MERINYREKQPLPYCLRISGICKFRDKTDESCDKEGCGLCQIWSDAVLKRFNYVATPEEYIHVANISMTIPIKTHLTV